MKALTVDELIAKLQLVKYNGGKNLPVTTSTLLVDDTGQSGKKSMENKNDLVGVEMFEDQVCIWRAL